MTNEEQNQLLEQCRKSMEREREGQPKQIYLPPSKSMGGKEAIKFHLKYPGASFLINPKKL